MKRLILILILLPLMSGAMQQNPATGNLNLPDAKGRTPLLRAIETRNAGSALSFIKRGADVNMKDARGRSALHMLTATGMTEYETKLVLEKLIAAGADVDSHDAAGNTPLMDAIAHGRMMMVKLLLNAGADRSIVNGGLTAHDMAKKRGYNAIARLL